MEDLIRAVKSLIIDIESMQPHGNPDNYWFGPFSESEETMDGTIIEWPNLAILLADVKKLLEPKTIEGELTKSAIIKAAAERSGVPVKQIPLSQFNHDDLKGYPTGLTNIEDPTKVYPYTEEGCPSKHYNDGSDICQDCGKDLQR